jgi:hypothetical protein
VLRLRAATRKGRCATRRRSRDTARVMRVSSSSRYQRAPRPIRSGEQTSMVAEECRVVRKKIPTRRTVFRSSTAAPPPTVRLSFMVAGTKSPKTRAERESCAMSETIVRYGWPGVQTTQSCHISSNTHRQPPYHNIPRDLQIASLQIPILMPSATIAKAPVIPSDWETKALWAKSGTLMTISEYRMVHDQTICSNGRYWELFHSRLRRLSISHVSLCSRVFLYTRSIATWTSSFLHQNTSNRYLHTSTARMTVQRITMFKVASEADIPKFLEQYQTLAQNQKKVRCVNCQAQIVDSMADRFPYRTGRQAIHPLSRCPPPSKRSSYPRLQCPCTHNLLFPRRCKILR